MRKLVIRNLGTGAVRETTSDERGAFVATNLLPAKYSVLVEAAGFTKLDQQVELPPGGRLSLDLKLQVGRSLKPSKLLARTSQSIRRIKR